MMFSQIARAVAVLLVLFGIGRIMLGLSGNPEYFTGTPGAMIDKGVYTILVGIALGALAEIGLALGKKQ